MELDFDSWLLHNTELLKGQTSNFWVFIESLNLPVGTDNTATHPPKKTPKNW